MAYLINEDCINCGACEPECPNEAISEGDPVYTINPDLCTECVGYHDEPQCISVCPVDCIEVNPDYKETKEQLLKKNESMKSTLS
ncbi:MAG: YfhL family 4Fe-4S dicluster ferredoxin [Ignavibacteriaceae bacterium]|jgi:ferredoxin|nr:YfhL family 4Fe-4S dicluster ferredoxin [Ignavibacteriaceae bacterium]